MKSCTVWDIDSKNIPNKDYTAITQQILLTLSEQHDWNNISLTEIGLKSFRLNICNTLMSLKYFLENIIRDKSTKIVKDEISEFLRRELIQKHRYRWIWGRYTVWASRDLTSNERNSYGFMWIFHLKFHVFRFTLYTSDLKTLERQKCEEISTRNRNYSKYNFSTTDVILNWNVKIDEVLCASFGFT